MNRKTLGKIILGLIITAAVVFGGLTVWGNFFANKTGEVKMPTQKEAAYALTVKNTTTVLFADKVEVMGEAVGNRTYILNGYWELQGSKFVWKSGQLVMAEKVWGEITMKKRVAG
jgi:hypothetical protein